MRFTKRNTAIANAVREHIQKHTLTVSDGEAIAMSVLWVFFMDHAEAQGLDVDTLAREQMEAFIKDMAPKFKILRIARPRLNG